MWAPFAVLLLAGTVLADSRPVWKPDNSYQYLVRSRALSGAEKVSQQYTGISMRGLLNIYVQDVNTLMVELTQGEFSPLHKKLSRAWDSPNLDKDLEYRPLPLVKHLYKVKLENNRIQEVFAEPSIPVWQVNNIKGILSQLQFTLDEKQQQYTDNLDEDQNTFTVKEQSVTGNCDTTYDIIPATKNKLKHSHVVPIEGLQSDKYLDVIKNRNYAKCSQLPMYQFSITNFMEKNLHRDYLARSTSTNMIISCNDQHHTIRSSVMKNVMQVRPKLRDYQGSTIVTMMNMTLVKFTPGKFSSAALQNVVSAGNLTYIYSKNNERNEPLLVDLELNAQSSESYESSSKEQNNDNMSSVRNRFRHSILSRNSNRNYQNYEGSSESQSQEYGYIVRKPEVHETMVSEASYIHGVKSQKYNELSKNAISLINEMVTEVMARNEVMRQPTMEKFTILANIIRFMDAKDLDNLVEKIGVPSKTVNKNDERSMLTWSIFRDAVAQAGTGPALLVIRNWIVGKTVKGFEAADLVARLPRVVREPTAKYMDEFYQLIQKPEVKNEMILNTTALYAFTELVRYAMVWDQQYFYPVRTYGVIINKEERKRVNEVYIPYLANELKSAWKAKNNNQILAYTIALGNIGHQNIISVYEPYLEGKREISTFQRVTMVNALKKLTTVNPKAVANVAFKIYLNERENYEVRVAATHILLKSNPSLIQLKRMAERTEYESDPHVNNVVVTGIRSLASLRQPKYRELARKARIAAIMLKSRAPTQAGYSFIYNEDFVSEDKDVTAWFNLNTIGGIDKSIPNFMHISSGLNASSMTPPSFRLRYGVTNMQSLLDFLKGMFLESRIADSQTIVDKMAERLNIVLQKKELLELTFALQTPYGVHLVILDEQMLLRIFKKSMGSDKELFEESVQPAWSKFADWELTIGYPSEIGLPMLYRLKTPQMVYSKTKLNLAGKLRPLELQVNADVDMISSKVVMSRIGFVTPFDNQHYISGIDVNSYVYVPATINFKVDLKNKEINVNVKPLQAQNKVLHIAVTPFTSNVDVHEIKPIRGSKNTHVMYWQEPNKKVLYVGDFVIKTENDNFQPNMTSWHAQQDVGQLLKTVLKSSLTRDLHYQSIEVETNFDPNADNSININIKYDKQQTRIERSSQQEQQQSSEEFNKLRSSLNSAEEINKIWNELNSQEVNSKEMNEFSSQLGNKPYSYHASAIVELKIPRQNIRYHCSGAIAQVIPRYNILVGGCHFHKGSSLFQMCASGYSENDMPQFPLLNAQSRQNVEKRNLLKMTVKYGEDCDNGKNVNIVATQTQSKALRKAVESSEEYEKCKEEQERGNLGLNNCQKLAKWINVKDNLEILMTMDPSERELLTYHTLNVLRQINKNDIEMKVNNARGNLPQWNWIKLNVRKLPHNEILNVTFSSQPLTARTFVNLLPISTSFVKNPMYSAMGYKDNNICAVGKTKVRTFDGSEYPFELKKCPHVLLISPTRRSYRVDPNNEGKILDVPDNRNVAILAEKIEDDQTKLTIIKKNKVLNIKPTLGNRQQPVSLSLDGKNIKIKDLANFNSELGINIVDLPHGRIQISIRPEEIEVWFDGRNVHISAAESYNGAYGLCGYKDNVQENDFMAPKGCIMKEPSKMAALYAYDDGQCPSSIRKDREEAERSECVKQQNLQSNVVSNKDTRRRARVYNRYGNLMAQAKQQGCTKFRTQVLDDGEQICFSLRPVPVCDDGCQAENNVSKPVGFHCEPISSETVQLKRRIESGANPNFDEMPVSREESVEIPINCRSL